MSIYRCFRVVLLSVFFSNLTNAQIIGSNAYLIGDYVEVGIAGDGGFEGADTALGFVAGAHFRSANPYLGFVTDPTMSSWSQFDGDFFTPGDPENGWGIELGGIEGVKANNNCSFYSTGTTGTPQMIPGFITDYVNNSGAMSVCWDGDYVGSGYDVSIHINYSLNQADLFYSTEVTIKNNGPGIIDTIYYHRNIDPDNNVYLTGNYSTVNSIISQGDIACSKALVTAEQSLPWGSYIGLAAFGENFRVTYGGFSNRDASDLWNYGTGGIVGTPGSVSSADEAISLAYFIENLDSGMAETFRYVIILDSSQTDNALNHLFQFQYAGDLIGPISNCEPVADTVFTCTSNPVDIMVVGQAVNDFTWTWSPSIGLDTLDGVVVNANPDSTTTYTATGTPISSCFTSQITKDIIVVSLPGPNLHYVDPGRQCSAFDLSTLVYTDSSGLMGTMASFQSQIPTSAADTTNALGTLIMHQGDTVFLVISDTITGCFDYEQIVIDWGVSIDLTLIMVPSDCGLNNGSINVAAVSGGSAPYTYQWFSGPSDSLYAGIGPGFYTITVTDSAGCSVDSLIALASVGSAVIGSLVGLTPSECNMPNGSFTVVGSGGLGDYSYDIGVGPQMSGSFSGLMSGSYLVLVTDSAGCADLVNVEVSDTSTLALTLLSQNSENCSGSNGSLEVEGSGGALGYAYNIGFGNQSSGIFNGLAAGVYSVEVIDAGGCTDTLEVTIIDSVLIEISLVYVSDALCAKNNGEIEVNGESGVSPFSYNIGIGPQSNGLFTELYPGQYTIVVTDSLGCMDSLIVDVGDTNTLSYLILNVIDENCGFENGLIDVVASGGIGPYTYSLDGSSQTSGLFEGLNSGTLSLTIADSIGCVLNAIIEVNSIPLEIDLGSDIVSCEPVILSSDEGSSYFWSTSETEQIIEVNSTGVYTLDYEFNGCFASDSISVTINPKTSIMVPNVFTPDGNGQNDEFKISGLNIQKYHIVIYNRWGIQLFESNSISNSWDGMGSKGIMEEGVYFWTIDYINPCIGPEIQFEKGIFHLYD